VVLSRLLQADAFGLIALATACLSFFGVIADLGFSTWIIQARTVGRVESSTVFWTSASLGIVFAVVVFASADVLAALLDAPELGPILRVLSLSLVISGLSGTPAALLIRGLQFRTLAVREILTVALGAAAGIITAALTRSVWALVVQQLTQQITACIALYAVSGWRPMRCWSRPLAKEMATFGTKMFAVTLLQQLHDHGESLLIGRLLGPTALGYWAIAIRLVVIVKDVSMSAISSVATPTFSRLRDNNERLARAYESSLAASTAVVGPCMALLAIASPIAIPLVFGPQWAPSVPIAIVFGLTSIISPMTAFDRAILLARERIDVEIKLVLFIVGVHLASVYVIGPYGLLPLAIAIGIRPLVTWPLRIGVLRRVASIPYRTQLRAAISALTAALAALIIAAGGQLLGHEGGWPALIVGSALYVAVYVLLAAVVSRSLFVALYRDTMTVLKRPADVNV
jgi:PST family polysaccharide transporter